MADPALSTSDPGTVTGLFKSRDGAECAYQSAVELGYEKSDISVVMSQEIRERFFSSERRADSDLSHNVTESTAGSTKLADELGGPTGGAVGTIAPVLAAAGTLVLIPGIAVAGPVALALAAAGAVGLAGGLIGALTNWGIREDRIHQYEAGIRGGGILIGVKIRSGDNTKELEQRWKACGGELVHS
jgi:hypothetical protein